MQTRKKCVQNCRCKRHRLSRVEDSLDRQEFATNVALALAGIALLVAWFA